MTAGAPVAELLTRLVRDLKLITDFSDHAHYDTFVLAETALAACQEPIPMLLFCPNCGLKHIDKVKPEQDWTNPPHRSHRCDGCFYVWRPADVPTTGVETIATAGKLDGPAQPRQFALETELGKELLRMALQLRTQDNSFTEDPIFTVQQRVRDYGLDPDHSADGICWHNNETEQTVLSEREEDQRVFAALERGYESHTVGMHWGRTGYRNRWEFVQPFVTLEAAELFRTTQAHRLGPSRIYVESGYRNWEWQTVRQYLLRFAQTAIDDPELDGTDGAHPAWWRGHDRAVTQTLATLSGVLDNGKHAVYGDLELETFALHLDLLRTLLDSKRSPVSVLHQLIDSDEPPGLAAANLAQTVVALVSHRDSKQALHLARELNALAEKYPREG